MNVLQSGSRFRRTDGCPMSSLDRLRPGDRGVIAELIGDDPVTVRLLEMGLLPGEPVEVLGVAPLGDPLAIRVRGTRLALRRIDAARVQLVSPPAADERLAAAGPS